MATYSIKAPDGNTYQIEGPDGASQSDVIQQVLEQHPNAAQAPAPIKGLAADVGSTLAHSAAGLRAGVKGLFGTHEDANAAAQAGVSEREDIAQRYETHDSLDAIQKAYKENGLGSAVGATFKEAPHVAAQLGTGMAELLGPSMAGAVIGGGLGTLVGGVPGGIAGANLGRNIGTGLSVANKVVQHAGIGAVDTAAEQAAKGLPVDVDMGKSLMYAAPETALDFIQPKMLGRDVIGKVFGPQVSSLLAKGATKEANVAAQELLAKEGFRKTLARGVGEGAGIGVPSGVAQVALQRSQAGQDLFNDDALHAYGSAATTGLLGSPVGAVGSFGKRGEAREAVAGRAAEAAKVIEDTAEAHRQTPAYAADIDQQMQALRAQQEQLQENSPSKPVKNSSTYEEDAALHNDFKSRIQDVREQIKELTPEHTRTQELHGAAAEPAAPVAVDPLIALKAQERELQRNLLQPLPDKASAEYEGGITERKASVSKLAELRQEMQSIVKEQALVRPLELPAETSVPLSHTAVKAQYEDVIAKRQQAKEKVAAAPDAVAKKKAVTEVQALTKQAKDLEPAYNNANAQAKAAAPELSERVDALMQDPVRARQYLEEFPQATDYTPQQNEALRSSVKLRMAALDKRAQQTMAASGVPKEEIPTAPRSLTAYRTAENAQGAAPDYVRRLVDKTTEGWTNAPKIEVHADEATLPQKLRDQLAGDNKSVGKVGGLYDPTTKVVHLLSKNLGGKDDIVATIAHEIAGHYGLQEMLGDRYMKTMDMIHKGNKTVQDAAAVKLQENPKMSRQLATEEVLADMAEQGKTSTPEARSALRQVLDAVKQWFHEKFGIGQMSDNAVKQILANARKHVMDGEPSTRRVAAMEPARAAYRDAVPENLKGAVGLANELVAPPSTKVQQVKEAAQNGDLLSLAFVTKMVDQYAPVLKALSGKVSDAVSLRVAYGLKEFNQGSNLISAAMRYGAPKLVESRTSKEGAREYLFETATNAPSMESLNTILKDAHALTGSDANTGALWSLYTAAARAANVGLAKLNFGPDITQARLNKALADIRATPGLEDVFKRATEEWRKINASNIEFTVQTGFMSKETANILLAHKDYVPYYREDAHGNVDIFAGGTKIARIGSVVDHPYLHELVGDNQRILDFNTAATQNISMLIRAGLKNYAAQGAAEALHSVGMADLVKGVAGKQDNAFSYKKNGVDYRAIVNDSNPEVPAKLLVQGLQGIPVQTNALLKLAGMPSQLMRTMYVSNPLSAVKNIFKDTMSAWLVSGSDLKSVLGAFKSVEDNLMVRRGLSGGEVFQGLPADQAVLLNQVRSGKPGWATAVAKLHAVHARLDAVSRQARYESYRKAGMGDLEASMAALNSANFTRRGMSSSLHILNTLNPFINSQIQGMDNLYRAARGTSMFNDKLQIRTKMIQRGMLIAASSLLYAALMQDDEDYQKATPDQKYNNWFVRIPGVDEAVRVPIPFEAGLMFKALPEAMMSYIYGNDKDAADGIKMILQRAIPGGDTYGIPLALRPAIEAGLGKSFYTGRDLETKHEQGLEAGFRQRPNTSALADTLGEQLGLSPVKLDHLISGHTGTLGLAVAQLASSLVFGKDTPEIEGRMSQVPIIGASFQPEDAGNLLNRAYAAMEESAQVKRTYDDLIAKGRYDAAQAYLEKNASEYSKASMGAKFQQSMSQLTKVASQITNNTALDMSPKDRRDALRALKEQQSEIAKGAISALGETTHP